MTPDTAALARQTQRRAWIILFLTALFWGGNAVASRLAVGEISPMALVTVRWGMVSLIMLTLCWRQFSQDLPAMRQHWRAIVLMAFFGFTAYQALFFAAAHATSGVHLAILQGVGPVFIFIGARLFYKTPIGLVRGFGLALTLFAILIIAAHGDLTKLLGMDLNLGDAAMVLASFFYAAYTLALRKRPNVSALGFFTALSLVATFTSLPLLIAEAATSGVHWPTTMKGLLTLGYIIVFPSLLAQVFFIRGVGMIGPQRASLFYNLVPALGAIMAATILGEPFESYHAVGLALALAGVFIAEAFGAKRG